MMRCLRIWGSSGDGSGLEILILIVTLVVAPARSPPVGGPGVCTGGGRHDGIEAVRSGDCRSVRDRGRRAGDAAVAMPSRMGETIRGELTSTQGVRKSGRRDAGAVGGRVGTSRGRCVGVVTNGIR